MLLATGSRDKTVKIFDPKEEYLVIETFREHDSAIIGV